MKILYIVSSLPDEFKPYNKPFVKSQIDSIRNQNVEIEIWDLKATENTFNYFKAISKIQKIIANNNFDLIHCHYSYTALPALFQNKIPVIVSFMGCDLYGDKKTNGNFKYFSIINIFYSLVIQYLINGIIVKSKNMLKYIHKKKHCHVIPNGVDLNDFYPEEKNYCRELLKLPKDKKIILFLGDPTNERKNYQLALKAYNILKNVIEDIILINPFGISQTEVCNYLNSANVLVLTSVEEGSPNIIKEAMACNCPVVSTDVGDARELFGNLEGHFITTFEPQNVAMNIQKALNFGKRTRGRERLMEIGLDSDTVAKRIIEVYESVCQKNRNLDKSNISS